MVKKIIFLLFRAAIFFAYQGYRIEGVNALLLLMPAKLIIPTLRRYKATIGNNVEMHSPLIIHNAKEDYSNLIIGNDCYLGRGVLLDLSEKILIGDNSTVSHRSSILTHTDVGKSFCKLQIPATFGSVTIEKGVYLGTGSIILHKTTIGEGSALSAGSVVSVSVPPYALMGGNPARFIRNLTPSASGAIQ